MEKNLSVRLTALILSSILFLIGCTKSTNDLLEGTLVESDQPVSDLNDLDQMEFLISLRHCQIQQFHMGGDIGGREDIMFFSYNRFGNPVLGQRSNVTTGSPNFVFRYDKYNRLTDFIGPYHDINNFDAVEFWHKYFYDRFGRIAKDSAYIFPSINNGQPTPEIWKGSVITYKYDKKNRINQTTEYFTGKNPIITNYSYVRGNLVGSTYDNKMNFRQTNKIWQFLDRNYSLNNSTAAVTYKYNNVGLPIKILVANSGYGRFIITGVNPLSYQEAYIKYICENKQ